jgi:hypothetical protein
MQMSSYPEMTKDAYSILDLDGLFNDQIALPIRDDNLLQGGECVQHTPDRVESPIASYPAFPTSTPVSTAPKAKRAPSAIHNVDVHVASLSEQRGVRTVEIQVVDLDWTGGSPGDVTGGGTSYPAFPTSTPVSTAPKAKRAPSAIHNVDVHVVDHPR